MIELHKPKETMLCSLVREAVRAPSGDNTQPWRFALDPENSRIVVRVDETRDPSPMNAGQRMARIGVGAAVENILRTATHNGGLASVESIRPEQIVIRAERITDLIAADVIQQRTTNRKRYHGTSASSDVLAKLAERTPELDGVSALWITDRSRMQSLARCIGSGDAMMFGESSMRRAFLANVRFDAPPDESVSEGLPLASLEMSEREIAMFRRVAPLADWLLRTMGFGRTLAKNTRRLVESSAGLCVGVAADRKPETDFAVGRVMQRAWLALTECGLAVQPMMSLPVLGNALQHGTDSLRQALGAARVEALLRSVSELIPEARDRRCAFILRFGYADPPSGRTGRLPLEQVLTTTSGAA